MDTLKILELIFLIIVTGMIFSKLSKILHMPDVVLFILGGVILGPRVLNLINAESYPIGNELILTFGAAYILYDGGREIELKVLNKVKLSVLMLATLGVLISTFITGYFSSKILHIDFTYALLLGSVIASTDPSVLVPLFKNMNISDKLKQTIISESAFNDAAGAIITFSILGVITGGVFSLQKCIFDLLITAGGGILVGLIVGFLASTLISHDKYAYFQEHPAEMGISAVVGAYVIATKLGVSGFMAVFMVGMVCGNKKILNMWVPDEQYVTQTRFKEVLTIILRMMIFILLGTQINFTVLSKYWKEAFLIVGVLIFIARPISAFISVVFDKKANWNFREIIYLMWVRETGVIPAALAGMLLSQKIQHAEIISSVTFMAIIITLTFQASTSKALANFLKLNKA
ncbi:sodium:proton antiporter [Fervidicella metallireducens AeB]|uniref:Sodium:proton antiporter n=1 Tax=Fervidicella metallireducens AeB TaxID=1403537 RepID=A0A017RTN5_9CLOT|nr:sodium:proton antiporter [Fervidicella metallireducens]EYE87265.1 sodium:proton antiporter [Fervidicella metallireducens AeB]